MAFYIKLRIYYKEQLNMIIISQINAFRVMAIKNNI